MKNSYKGYWFSCETRYHHNGETIMPRKWFLLLESKLNNRTHSIGLNNQMTLGEVLELAYVEINKLEKETKKNAS